LRKLSPAIIERISDFEAESDLSVQGFALEKDHFVLEAIKLIKSLPTSQDFRFVFCGGTCLAKAYGLLHRMSEDVDFKLIPTLATAHLSKTALRNKLSDFIKEVIENLENGGFGKGTIVRRSLDNNNYSSLDIQYESAFSKPSSLRSHLQIELNHSQLRTPTQIKPVGLLLDKLIFNEYREPIELECISIQEALAEKLISFPRRLALQLEKVRSDQALEASLGWDKALVRHLYDVHQITQNTSPEKLSSHELAEVVSNVIIHDAIEFQNQHPLFCTNPFDQLTHALAHAANNEKLKFQYNAFIMDMVYAPSETIPSFDQALSVFSKVLENILTLNNQEKIANAILGATYPK